MSSFLLFHGQRKTEPSLIPTAEFSAFVRLLHRAVILARTGRSFAIWGAGLKQD